MGKWLDFGDIYLIFKVTPALWMSNFDQKKLVCILSLEPNDRVWPVFMYYIIGVIKKLIDFGDLDLIFKTIKMSIAGLHSISGTNWWVEGGGA